MAISLDLLLLLLLVTVLLNSLRDVPLMIPLFVQEVREPAGSHVHELMEDGGDHCAVMDLEVEAGVG